jgi:hypothetical protein
MIDGHVIDGHVHWGKKNLEIKKLLIQDNCKV